MTILWGDTGKNAYGPLKTFTFQCATPRETALGTLSLPNAEGTTNQVSYTVQQSDLPSVTPSPVSMKYLACIITSGKCTTAATINYRIFKNGTSLTTSNFGGSANQYWTNNHWRWYDIQVGDVLEVRHWSNQTDTTLDYACLMIYPATVVLSKVGTILKDLTYTNATTTSNPTPTGAGVRTISISNTGNLNWSVGSNASLGLSTATYGQGVTSGTPLIIPFFHSHSTGTIRLNYGGDISGTVTNGANNATLISIQKNGIPATVSFREILR